MCARCVGPASEEGSLGYSWNVFPPKQVDGRTIAAGLGQNGETACGWVLLQRWKALTKLPMRSRSE